MFLSLRDFVKHGYILHKTKSQNVYSTLYNESFMNDGYCLNRVTKQSVKYVMFLQSDKKYWDLMKYGQRDINFQNSCHISFLIRRILLPHSCKQTFLIDDPILKRVLYYYTYSKLTSRINMLPATYISLFLAYWNTL